MAKLLNYFQMLRNCYKNIERTFKIVLNGHSKPLSHHIIYWREKEKYDKHNGKNNRTIGSYKPITILIGKM